MSVFEKLRPFLETSFYENELTQTFDNLPLSATKAEKIAAIDERLASIKAQIESFYKTVPALISTEVPILSDLNLLEKLLRGEKVGKLEYPYDCIEKEISSIRDKLNFLSKDSNKFAELLKETLPCDKNRDGASSGC